MRVIVTGGCGFIGSNFIRLILDEVPRAVVCNVDLLTYAGNLENLAGVEEGFKGRYFFERADIADRKGIIAVMDRFKPEAIVNFAAETHVDRSIEDASPFIHSNVIGTQNLLQLAGERGLDKFVQVSTDEVYGSLGPEGCFTETTPLAPNSPYSASKASADLFCRAWHETYGLPVVVTRCSNNYGPFQFPEKLIPLMYSLAVKDQPLPVYGDGQNIRDWIHVRDHCRGVLLALLKAAPGTVYNFGGQAERTNLEVVRGILAHCGKPDSLVRFVKDRPGHDRRYAMDFSLAAKELGYAPEVTFEKGLEQTLDWYAANAGWIENVTSGAYKDFMSKWYGDRL